MNSASASLAIWRGDVSIMAGSLEAMDVPFSSDEDAELATISE